MELSHLSKDSLFNEIEKLKKENAYLRAKVTEQDRFQNTALSQHGLTNMMLQDVVINSRSLDKSQT